MKAQLYEAMKAGVFSPLDVHFAGFMAELAGHPSDALLLAAALVSREAGEGSVCLELARCAGQKLPGLPARAPALEAWRESLFASGVVGGPGERAPLILDGQSRLYLARYHDYERQVAGHVLLRAATDMSVDTGAIRAGLDRLFPDATEPPDWQRIAAAVAVLKRFAVISGGPGTGKTTTVARLLALLIGLSSPQRLRIVIAAPTGKAAARLSESIMEAKKAIAADAVTLSLIPDKAVTLHRLLGAMPGRSGYRHHRENPLHLDVLVADEASMVDLPLMAHLMQAMPARARLVLLGDKDQLASVEAGSVLGDICALGGQGHSSRFTHLLNAACGTNIAPADNLPALADCIVVLRKSYRFMGEGGIGALAQAVNEGQADLAWQILLDDRHPEVAWEAARTGQLHALLAQQVVPVYREYLQSRDPAEALRRFGRMRVLCALRAGPSGVAQINAAIENVLHQHDLIQTDERWYRGRPIMVVRNDYGMQLFNGDIGILWPDAHNDNRLRACFLAPDGTLRRIAPNRLPEHETVYAMTVHKSQGSEFDQVVMMLPEEQAPVLTRELIYTGITRARKSVRIWGGEAVFRMALKTRMERASGLKDALSVTIADRGTHE